MQNKIFVLKTCFLLIIAFLLSETIISQNTNPYSYIDSISYRIKFDDVQVGGKIRFIFPPLENGPYLLEAIEAKSIKDNHIKTGGTFYGCKILLVNKLLITRNQNLNIKFYSNNIDSLFVGFYNGDNDRKNIVKCLPLEKHLSYFNINLELDNCFKRKDDLSPSSDSKQNKAAIKEITVCYKHKKNQKLIIGDLMISSLVKVQGENQEDLIRNIVNKYSIIKNNEEFKGITDLTAEKNIDLFGIIPENILKTTVKEELIKDEDREKYLINRKSTEKKDLSSVSALIRNILVDYFNSTENKRDHLIKEYDLMVQHAVSLDDYYEKLKIFIPKLEDTHMNFTNEKKLREEYVTLPIYFYNIKKEVVVVSILDPSLGDVSLGDKLLSINNIPIFTVIDNVRKYTVGSNDHAKNMKILQKLLYYACNEFGDSLDLELSNIEGKTYTVHMNSNQVLHNKNIQIPDNIEQSKKRLDYKKINNYSYFKISQFKSVDFRPFFYSIVDSILESDGLIIDLRNSYGGDLSTAFLFSFFIKSPSIYFSHGKEYHETLIIKPDPYYYYPNPIVIIFDARTTCGPEFLINALLKARSDVVTVATERSAGSAQRITYLDLPETDRFKGTLMYRNSTFLDAFGNNMDLSGGIKPDIWTGFDSYLDLAPYNDKLLSLAIKYLDEKVKPNKNKSDKEKSNLFIIIIICGIIIVLSSYLLRKKIKFL